LVACVLTFNTLRPVHGRAQEDELKKQVESLTKKVEDQKKQLDSLRADHQNFKAVQEQWDKGMADVVTQHGNAIQNINARLHAKGI
jgi:phage shock protein A